jgi:hypothetical protein
VQWALFLLLLLVRPLGMSQNELSAIAGIGFVTLNHFVDRIEALGIAQRRRALSDRPDSRDPLLNSCQHRTRQR